MNAIFLLIILFAFVASCRRAGRFAAWSRPSLGVRMASSNRHQNPNSVSSQAAFGGLPAVVLCSD